MMKVYLLAVWLLTLSCTANSALVSVLGGKAFYDDVADLTWLADADYARTSGYDADGLMTWVEATTWATSLSIDGVSGWRLPTTIDVGNDGTSYLNGLFYTGVDAGYNMTDHSELSNLWYNVLGNIPYYDTLGNSNQPGNGLTNTGQFINLVSSARYWSSTEYAPLASTRAWGFRVGIGYQDFYTKVQNYSSWAVISGNADDLQAVPLPSVLLLFGIGFLGMTMFRRN